ncbi:DUF2867 domain-containing protein [Bradyrhizobium sp. CB82]|uniref:DUF2867 domain-containing protein n=1 Tax=Bradyrhizobium sp. CB82 TaxID=3039159 RepID=UPI0024B10E20|nr:DUF2867 domain-containing protein [Bradyrhizobium sp. CB82]WFU40983.1 DUF2867 domain-containing protein [Bradyrhizobium sp. CB82]
MTPVREVTPEVDADALLAGAQFVDAHRVAIGGIVVDVAGGPTLSPQGNAQRPPRIAVPVALHRRRCDWSRQKVTSTTLVRTHNLLGRLYLALIMPFHKLVVRGMMRRIAEAVR